MFAAEFDLTIDYEECVVDEQDPSVRLVQRVERSYFIHMFIQRTQRGDLREHRTSEIPLKR